MIAVMNRLPVKEGASDQLIEMFANGQGTVQEFPGFTSMEVLRSQDKDEVVVITWWESREAFSNWVHSEAFSKAHGRSGGELLTGHPQMGTYEVALERKPV